VPAAECTLAVCAPADPGAGPSGCSLHAADEGTFCSEDGDPCTADVCQGGACTHHPDGSGPRCPLLDTPFRTAADVLALARGLEADVRSAAASGCPVTPGCELAPGATRDRLVALLGATRMDLEAALQAIGGHVAGPPAPDPTVRARLALGLIAGTPGEVRSFLATLAQARERHLATRTFARRRASAGREVLRGTQKLAHQLRRMVARTGTFVPAP